MQDERVGTYIFKTSRNVPYLLLVALLALDCLFCIKNKDSSTNLTNLIVSLIKQEKQARRIQIQFKTCTIIFCLEYISKPNWKKNKPCLFVIKMLTILPSLNHKMQIKNHSATQPKIQKSKQFYLLLRHFKRFHVVTNNLQLFFQLKNLAVKLDKLSIDCCCIVKNGMTKYIRFPLNSFAYVM